MRLPIAQISMLAVILGVAAPEHPLFAQNNFESQNAPPEDDDFALGGDAAEGQGSNLEELSNTIEEENAAIEPNAAAETAPSVNAGLSTNSFENIAPATQTRLTSNGASATALNPLNSQGAAIQTAETIEAEFVPESPGNLVIPMEQTPENAMTSEGAATDPGIASTFQPPERPKSDLVKTNEFAGTPFFPGTKRNLAGGEAPESYKVQPGDTLFDICDQLIDEGDYWPKLWALNPGIKNPHFIFPGIELTFYPGDEDVPPYLQVLNEPDVVPIENGGAATSELLNVDISGLLFENFKTPDLEIVEASLVPIASSDEFEAIGNVYNSSIASVTVPAFMFQDEVKPLAVIVGGTLGEMIGHESNETLIRSEQTLSTGSTFTVVRPSGEIESPGTGDFYAYRYEFVGHLMVKGNLPDGYQVTNVTLNQLAVQPGDLVINYAASSRNYSLNGVSSASSDPKVAIIGFNFPGQTFAGQGDVVFLDGNLSTGQTFPIYQMVSFRAKPGATVPDYTKKVGDVRVLGRLSTGSIGIITNNTMDVRIGDRLGKG